MGQGKHTAVRESQSLAVWEKKLLSLTSLQTFKNCNSKTMQCIQGFPKDVKGRGIPLVEDRMGDFAGRFGGGWRLSSGGNLMNLSQKLKTRFCKYWTPTKIKSSMTCVYKEYEIKINTQVWVDAWQNWNIKDYFSPNLGHSFFFFFFLRFHSPRC